MASVSTPTPTIVVITPAGNPTGPTVSGDTAIANVATYILELILVLGGALAVIYIVYAGFQLITSSGDPTRAKQARSAIVNGIIGVIIITSAFTVVRLVTNISLGFNNII